jgi:hypothetical protein
MEGEEEMNPWGLRKEDIEAELGKTGLQEIPSLTQPKSEFVDLYYKHIIQASPHPNRTLTHREENPDRMRQNELAKVLKEHSVPIPRGKTLAEIRLRYKRYVLGEGFEDGDSEAEEEMASPGSKRERSAGSSSSAGLMRKERIPKTKMHGKVSNKSDLIEFLKKIVFFIACTIAIFMGIIIISNYFVIILFVFYILFF